MSVGLSPGRNDVQFNAELSSKAIDAHYYNITDAEAWPVAGLLVLLDGQGQPVRAELHLYEELPSHIQEGAVRQSRAVLQQRYSGEEALPLRILQTSQMRDAMAVRLRTNDAAPSAARRKLPLSKLAAVVAAAVVVVVIMSAWGLRASQRDSSDSAGAEDVTTSLEAVQEDVGNTVTTSAESQLPALQPQIELPPSRNARPDLAIGVRVGVVPGLRLTLRSEPGADAGVPFGYMMDDDTAVIVGGPALAEGVSDTIVWWRVRLDDGTEAWAPANTSDTTLLIPAP